MTANSTRVFARRLAVKVLSDDEMEQVHGATTQRAAITWTEIGRNGDGTPTETNDD